MGDGMPYVGRATLFVSHSWLYRFKLLVDIVHLVAQETPKEYYWVDCFAINQHRVWDAGELDELGPTIKACGNLLIAASPWSAPLPFTRAWCLFEVYTAWLEDVPVSLRISPSD